jgi:hypothetical protein
VKGRAIRRAGPFSLYEVRVRRHLSAAFIDALKADPRLDNEKAAAIGVTPQRYSAWTNGRHVAQGFRTKRHVDRLADLIQFPRDCVYAEDEALKTAQLNAVLVSMMQFKVDLMLGSRLTTAQQADLAIDLEYLARHHADWVRRRAQHAATVCDPAFTDTLKRLSHE